MIQKILLDVEMLDGTVHEDLRVTLKDQIRFGDVRARHKWPTMEEDPIRFAGFLAYAAMCRLGLYDSTKGFEDFVDEVAGVSGDLGDAVDPTQ